MRFRRVWMAVTVALVAGAACEPVPVDGETAGAFGSDDFDRTELGSPWTVVDPAGDGTVAMEGAGTGDARLLLTVPGGSDHHPWGSNDAVRAMRPADDVDFTAVAKFESVPTLKYQLQGIVVEQDADDWLRFEVHHNGTNLRAYAASTTSGSSASRLNKPASASGTSYLRVTRAGDEWTLATSGDGTTWSTAGSFTRALDVSAVGVMVGNVGSPAPAHTAVVDYLFEASHPVDPEDGGAPPVEAHTLTTEVVGPGSIARSPDKPTYAAGEMVTLTAVADPGSSFSGWSGAASGSANPTVVTMTADTSVTATFAADATPPALSDVSVTPSTSSAVVTWTTDEPATSSVSVGPTTAYELGAFGSSEPTTSHSVTVTGLSPGTTYHYAASSTNGSGLVGSAADATFTTDEPPPSAFPSDDFNRTSLGPDWTVVDPRGDGAVALTGTGTSDAHLRLAVPGGTSHDAWSTNNSLRALRAAADVDFTAEVKFQSTPSAKYQMQGLLVQQDDDDWLRFDVHHTGNTMRAYASATVAGTATKRFDVGTPTGPTMWLRVARTGDQWALRTSLDGSTWSTAGSFTHALEVTAIGPFAGNAGSSAPAFEAVVDYLFETSVPLDPEDAPSPPPPPDDTPPAITGVAVEPSTSSAVVSWQTDDPASSSVAVGETTAYEMGSFGSAAATRDHTVTLTGLAPETTYHYGVSSTNGAGLVTTTADATFTTPASTGPTIDVWSGTNQVVGAHGQPQSAYNVLGNVADPDGVAALSYSLDGGPARNLTVGPTTRRVYLPGDFNADIAYGSLEPGPNEVVLTARDALSNVTTTTVVLDVQPGPAPLPYTADWSAAGSVTAAAQPVDGKWAVDGDTVRPLELGYDRLLALGDVSWSDYEVTVPVTPHSLGPGHNSHLSGAAMVGFALNWRGHTQVGDEQPAYWWFPTGALAWYRWFDSGHKLELFGNDNSPVHRSTGLTLSFGQTYIFKARAETVANGVQYSFKVWPQGQAEPTAWRLTIVEPDGPPTGSVGLISHHVDVQFGDVTVVPISP